MKTDMWSAGVLLFQLLSNTLPFQGSNEAELRASIEAGVVGETMKLPDQAMRFVAGFLQHDEKHRLTPSAAQREPWMKSHVPVIPPKTISSQILKRLRAFRGLDKFKQTFLRVVVHMLKDVSIAAPRRFFVQFDENGDGFVTLSEIRKAMLALEWKDNDIQRMSRALTRNMAEGPGAADEAAWNALQRSPSFQQDQQEPVITFSEFLAATFNREKHSDDKLWREAFCFFDKDLSGTLDRQELLSGLLGELTATEAEHIMTSLDVDGDNKVSYRETVKVMAGTTLL